MRSLILATDIYTRGGIARYTYTFASALSNLVGPENVDVLALLAYGTASDLNRQFRILGPLSDRLTLAAEARYAIKALALARRRYDLTVCSHLALAPIAAAIRLLYGTPFWVVCHGAEIWGALSFLKRTALGRSSLLLPISRFTAEKLRSVHHTPEDRMAILHNAIPNDFVSLLTEPGTNGEPEAAARNGERTLLAVGNLGKAHTYKGFDTLVQALPAILKRAPAARCVIVGEGDDQERLEKLAAELGVRDRVTFAGSVTDEELARCYRSCDVFVLPSKAVARNGNWGGEGFGRVYVEAALAARPVVGSSGGGAAEAVVDGRTGLLVRPESAKEVAAAVVRLLEDPSLADRMGRAGREWVMQNFTESALRGSLGGLLRAQGFGVRHS